MARVKVKQVKMSMNAGDINGLFEEMMGTKDADPAVILPKFVDARNLIRRIYRIFIQLAESGPLHKDFPDFKQSLDEIKQFAANLKESVYFNTVDGKEIKEESEEMYVNVSKDDLNKIYKKLKDNQHIKQLIVLCGKLKRYSQYIDDTNNLRDNFIGQEPGLSFVIFDFSTFDLKKLWSRDNIKPIIKKYVLSVLATLYKDIYELYKLITSPDVDIEKFTNLLLESIGSLKTQPKLSRCTKAFRRIEASVSLLKDKFSDYYRESVATGNPNMLMESFIVDVSNQGGADARLTREFREIIQYMHTLSQQNGRNKDPQVQKLFAMLGDNFKMMERGTGEVKAEVKAETTLDDIDLTTVANVEAGTGTDVGTGVDSNAVTPSKSKRRRVKSASKSKADNKTE